MRLNEREDEWMIAYQNGDDEALENGKTTLMIKFKQDS